VVSLGWNMWLRYQVWITCAIFSLSWLELVIPAEIYHAPVFTWIEG